MKLTRIQVERMVRKVLHDLQDQNVMTVKASADKIFERAVQVILQDLEREAELDREAHRMMDELEKQNPGGFQRSKMFPMLKKKLAQQKGIVL